MTESEDTDGPMYSIEAYDDRRNHYLALDLGRDETVAINEGLNAAGFTVNIYHDNGAEHTDGIRVDTLDEL